MVPGRDAVPDFRRLKIRFNAFLGETWWWPAISRRDTTSGLARAGARLSIALQNSNVVVHRAVPVPTRSAFTRPGHSWDNPSSRQVPGAAVNDERGVENDLNVPSVSFSTRFPGYGQRIWPPPSSHRSRPCPKIGCGRPVGPAPLSVVQVVGRSRGEFLLMRLLQAARDRRLYDTMLA